MAMDGLSLKSVGVGNLPDLVSPCILSGTVNGQTSLPTQAAQEMTREKLAFFHDRMRRGASAVVAYRGGRPVGLLEYYPIEVALLPVTGNDLYVVNCLNVPHDEGRDQIERELVAACVKDWSTRKGVVVLARGKGWDALGFEEVTRATWPEGDDLVLWLMKFWEVEEPKLVPLSVDLPIAKGRVRVDLFESGCCPWNRYVSTLVRRAAAELGPRVLLEEVQLDRREKVLRHGLSQGVAVNGEFQPWLRPFPIPTYETVRDKIADRL